MKPNLSSLSSFFLAKFLQTEVQSQEAEINQPASVEALEASKPSSNLSGQRPDRSLAQLSRGKEPQKLNANQPNLSFSRLSIYFGEVEAGTSKVEYLQVTNNGECPQSYSLLVPNGFNISPSSGSISPGNIQSFTVTFRPSPTQAYDSEAYRGFISFPGGQTVNLSGTGKKADKN